MNRAAFVLAATLAGAGCSGSPPPVLADDPGAPADPKKPTEFPTGNPDPGPGHTPAPIVLVHGLDGFDNIGPINYFYGVADALRKDGHEVFTVQMDAYNSSEVRGAQLLVFIDGVLKQTGAPKVKLICHSQGGLDCRYAASEATGKVAAIVSISTPHRGTPVADIALGIAQGPARDAMAAMLNVLGAVISGHPDMNAEAALETLTSRGAADFAKRHPDPASVPHYSIAGRSNMSGGDVECDTPLSAPFVTRWNAERDPSDLLLAPTGQILNTVLSPAPANDGLVPVASARWGMFLGCVPADHLDEMCQIANDPAGTGNTFDCHRFYRDLADWLVAKGH